MRNQDLFFNRELSWLEFNQRVLDEARDRDVPLLERLKFLAISASNLDEFFMVRVGGLKVMINGGMETPDSSGMSPREQMQAVMKRARVMTDCQYETFISDIEPALAENGIVRSSVDGLSGAQKTHLKKYFDAEIAPVLSPIAIRRGERVPLLAGGSLYIAVRLAPLPDERRARFAVMRLCSANTRFVPMPDGKMLRYLPSEDVVKMFLSSLFPGEQIAECRVFRVTRNADLSVRDEFAADLIERMEEVIDARKESDCVRLEIESGTTGAMLGFLRKILNVGEDETIFVRGPLDLSGYMQLASLSGYDNLKYKQWPPHPYTGIEPGKTMFDIISKRDVLLCHPFDGFDAVLRFLNESADDPDVIAIKQTLYRTSKNSPVVAALRRAALSGKSVTAVVELKARFDEARNIEWARDMELDGVQVVYGVKRLKTHAKLTLVTRREPAGITRYLHLGTGNYNEKTAALYTDVSYMTCDEDMGSDAAAFFNAITGYSQPVNHSKLVAAPIEMRGALLNLIHDEAERKRHKQKALIMAKMNSLVCPEIIQALYEASKAGVKIMLNVRGVCCLRPGVKGLSENISVISIVDRFLEHSRIFYFMHGGEERVCMSSADWMPRNLDRRIELMAPVEDPVCKIRLKETLKACFSDNVKARRLYSNGKYKRVKPSRGAGAFRSQHALYVEAGKVAEGRTAGVKTVFEPHMPPNPSQ